MVSTMPSNTLLLLIAICTFLSSEVESFSLHQSTSSAAIRDAATTIKSQQIRPSSTSLFMSDAALSLSGQEGACMESF